MANHRYRVYIAGSNARMLSSEIATTLGGRDVIRNVRYTVKFENIRLIIKLFFIFITKKFTNKNATTMILKENIKNKVDKLNNYELRVVELVIESLKRKNKTSIIKTSPAEYPFQEVIRLMGISPLNAEDIELGRQERI